MWEFEIEARSAGFVVVRLYMRQGSGWRFVGQMGGMTEALAREFFTARANCKERVKAGSGEVAANVASADQA